MLGPRDYLSGCNLIIAEVSAWVRHGAPRVRSLGKFKVDLYRRTPHLSALAHTWYHLTLSGLQSRFGDNWGQVTWNLSGLSPKRDWSSRGVKDIWFISARYIQGR